MIKINFLCFCIIIFLTTESLVSQIPTHPFPFHTSYTRGHIKPNTFTQTELDSQVTSFYELWKARYLKYDCGSNLVYVEFQKNANVSEGLGYGMMITAYMAGYDSGAKTLFDGLYNFYKAHPSITNPYLMAWKQENCITIEDGMQSASDGDIDIAFSLLLAHTQWGSNGDINYISEAKNIINAIMQDDINQNTMTVKLGDWVIPSDTNYYYSTRSSDFIFDHFRSFHAVTKDDNWVQVIDNCYDLIDSIQTNYSPSTGLLPDFIINVNVSPAPAGENFLESKYDGAFYYNACRDPWRITTDYLLNGEIRAKNSVNKINNWLKENCNNDPNLISPGYLLSGQPIDIYDSPEFVGAFAVSAMVDSSHQNWLDSTYNILLSMPFNNGGYFGNTLMMLYLLVLSGNYWVPESDSINSIQIDFYKTHSHFQPTIVYFDNAIQVKIPKYLGKYDLRMINLIGETVIANIGIDSQEITLDVSGLSQGFYFLSLFSKQKNEINNSMIFITK